MSQNYSSLCGYPAAAVGKNYQRLVGGEPEAGGHGEAGRGWGRRCGEGQWEGEGSAGVLSLETSQLVGFDS